MSKKMASVMVAYGIVLAPLSCFIQQTAPALAKVSFITGMADRVVKTSSALCICERTDSAGSRMALMTAQDGRSIKEVRQDGNYWGRLVESCIGAHLLNSSFGTNIEVPFGGNEIEKWTLCFVRAEPQSPSKSKAAAAAIHLPA